MNTTYRQLRHLLHPLRSKFELFLGKYYPKLLVSILYRECYGTNIDWEHPKTIGEKINWMKFYSDTTQWTLLADKYRVRQYVTDCGLEDILVPLYGKWDSANDIDWDSLPQQFVMKPNHGCHDVLICEDKQNLDTKYWTKQMNKWLHTDYSRIQGEPHYRSIPPCIIAEQLLDATKQQFPSSSLIDYKVWAFDGKPAYILCYLNRTPESVEMIAYDTDWDAHPEFIENNQHFPLSEKRLPRPATFGKMINAAARLSKGFPQVRVDFYEVDGKLYFGEMTFTSSSGFNRSFSKKFQLELGRLTKLPTDI